MFFCQLQLHFLVDFVRFGDGQIFPAGQVTFHAHCHFTNGQGPAGKSSPNLVALGMENVIAICPEDKLEYKLFYQALKVFFRS